MVAVSQKHISLKQRQSLPLEAKVQMSIARIRQWYDHWEGLVYVSFSGGKDSTVLLHIVRSVYPEVPAVFADTGLEYPEIRDFVKTIDNVVWVRPKMKFPDVLAKYGYPAVSKRIAQYVNDVRRSTERGAQTRRLRLTGMKSDGTFSQMSMIPKKWQYLIHAPFAISDKCCNAMKKQPMDTYQKSTGRYPYVGTMASEGNQRTQTYFRYGCNAYGIKRPRSAPMSFWTEPDIWQYLREHGLPYSSIYDMGYKRTGCMFCMFGAHLEPEPNRFQLMAQTHPRQYRYCMESLGCGKVLDHIGAPCRPQRSLFDTNPAQLN